MDTTVKQTQTRNVDHENQTTKRIVISIFGFIEAILAFRFIFKILGANPENGFVKVIYGATNFVVGIFKNIFSQVRLGGENSEAVFEPETLILMIVLALIAWIVLKIITPHAGEHQVKTAYSKNEDEDDK